MSIEERIVWDERYADRKTGVPEPFFLANLPLLRHGLALDVAAGRGRHTFALAREGFTVMAADFSRVAIRALKRAADAERLAHVWPVVADFDNFPLRAGSFDSIVNINFLNRNMFPEFARALKVGGVLLVDTFLLDENVTGHPRNPKFLLGHYELRDLLSGFELLRYCERLQVYPNGSHAWRAGAVARRRG